MDTEQFWQENKRFITVLLAGLMVFFVANTMVDRLYNADILKANRDTLSAVKVLEDRLYSTGDRALAEEENEALQVSYGKLVDAAAFIPRTGFVLGSSETAQRDYSFALEGVRERMADLASQRRAILPENLDLESAQTRNADVIERHLHAIDLVERVLRMALDAGIRRVRSIDVELDSAFKAKRGMGPIEMTKVTFDVTSDAEAVTLWLARAEAPEVAEGADPATSIRRQAIPIESLNMRRISLKDDEVRTTVTFLVIRIHEVEETEE